MIHPSNNGIRGKAVKRSLTCLRSLTTLGERAASYYVVYPEVKERGSEGFEKQAREKPMWEEEEHLRQRLMDNSRKTVDQTSPFPRLV